MTTILKYSHLVPGSISNLCSPASLRSALFLFFCGVAVVVLWPFRAGALEYIIVRDHNEGLYNLCLRASAKKNLNAYISAAVVCFFHTRVCVFQRRVRSASRKWERNSFVLRAQSEGTFPSLGPLAQMSHGSHWICSTTLMCFLSCQRPQWNKLNSDTSLSEVPMYAHAGRRLVQYSSLLSLSMEFFTVWNAICEFSSGQSVISYTTILLSVTLLSSYCEHCARPVQMSALSCQ